MKNLKKVFALLVVFTMVLSTVAFASPFADVDDDADYAEAVITMSALGLLKGDAQGNFNPDNTITRAEFAAVIVRTLGLGDPAPTATAFADVPATHWGSGYIKTATQLGILAGYGDGNFGPDDEVTYEQAIKMIVAALGYTPKANALGGYPAGYMVVAAQEGITKDANGTTGEEAKRSTVAMLVFNALDVPLMEQTGWGTDVVYQPMNGSGDTRYKTILTEKLDVTKVEGILVSDHLIKNIGKADDKKTARIEKLNYIDEYGDKKTNQPGETIYVGSVDVNEYLGMAVTCYIRDFKTDKELIAIAPNSSENNVLEISSDLVGVYDGRLYEYEDEDDVETDDGYEIKLSDTLAVYKNAMNMVEVKRADGEKYEDFVADIYADYIEGKSSNVKFIDNDDDDVYDAIVYYEYQYVVVDDVKATGKVDSKLANPSPRSIRFDIDGKKEGKVDYKIILDGQEIEPADLEENDVISFVQDSDSNPKMIIAYVTRETVSGTISQLDYDAYDNPIFELDNDKEYKTITDITTFEPDVDDYEQVVGDDFTFYLNNEGKVVYAVRGAVGNVGSKNYAVFYKAGKSAGTFSNTWDVMLFTADGEWITKEVASKFRVNGVMKNMEGTGNVYDTFINAVFGVNDVANIAKEKRLITYKLDNQGRIKEINVVNNNDDTTSYIKLDRAYAGANKASYKESTNRLGSYYLSDSTVIFSVINNGADEDDYSIITSDAFDDDNDEDYECYIYDSSRSAVAGAVLAYDVVGSIAKDAPLMVITGISKAAKGSDMVYRVTGYVEGEEAEVFIEDDGDTKVYELVYKKDASGNVFAVESNFNLSTLAKGDIIQYTADAEDVATTVRVIFDASNTGNDAPFYGASKYGKVNGIYETAYAYGEVVDVRRNIIELENGETFNTSRANIYEVDFTGRTISVKTDANIYTPGEKSKDAPGSFVIIREYDEVVTDVIVIVR